MRNNILTVLLVFLSLYSFGQITFEKGYIIDNNGQRIECLIKNNDWKNNPTEFEYKITASDNTDKGSANTVKEFGITGISRFVEANVKIDLSSYNTNNLSKTRDPEWAQEKLFLKVLVEGKATLYYYENNGLIRFFYSISPDSAVNQLVYKEYFEQGNKTYVEQFEISENKKFHEQLWVYVRCPNTGTADIEKLNYRKSDLVKYFISYNKCFRNPPVVYEKKSKKDSFHLKISPGINYSSLSVINNTTERFSTYFNNQFNFRIGIEGEYILPFNKNKWGILFEPTFQYFYDEDVKPTYTTIIQLNTVEFPIGLRYYFFLTKDLKLFANIIYVPSFAINFHSTVEKQNTVQSILPSYLEIQQSLSYAFGGGIAYKKYSAEIRYYTNRNLLRNQANWYTDYRRFSFILGFRIL